MLNDKCKSPFGHCLLFDLGQAPTPRLAIIMVKKEPAPSDYRRSLTRDAERAICGLSMRRDEGRVVDPPLVFKKGFIGDGRRALEEENLRRALDEENLRRVLKKETWTKIGVERKET
ncbi:hypothetical protein TNCV_63831 [Trichonephila clavipes]|nr:hypothetical protein TNCV_63831 [Trichonephila clavipes]